MYLKYINFMIFIEEKIHFSPKKYINNSDFVFFDMTNKGFCRCGLFLSYEKGFKPSKISLSNQIRQQEKSYQADKISPFFGWNNHKLQETAQKYKNIAKGGGYILAGIW